jgi:hypothetical protein
MEAQLLAPPNVYEYMSTLDTSQQYVWISYPYLVFFAFRICLHNNLLGRPIYLQYVTESAEVRQTPGWGSDAKLMWNGFPDLRLD